MRELPCPFSPSRLHELVWAEKFEPGQLVTLARALTGEDVEQADVERWMRDSGIAPRVPPVRAAIPARAAKPKPRPARHPGEGAATHPCVVCGTPVTRHVSQFRSEDTVCSRGCQDALAAARSAARRAQVRAAARVKRCSACDQTKPVAQFAVDQSRQDGRARICLECNQRKSRQYYERNQERLKARALERKRRKRGA